MMSPVRPLIGPRSTIKLVISTFSGSFTVLVFKTLIRILKLFFHYKQCKCHQIYKPLGKIKIKILGHICWIVLNNKFIMRLESFFSFFFLVVVMKIHGVGDDNQMNSNFLKKIGSQFILTLTKCTHMHKIHTWIKGRLSNCFALVCYVTFTLLIHLLTLRNRIQERVGA